MPDTGKRLKSIETADDVFVASSQAHVRLNLFYSVIALLESGCLPGGSVSADATASKIIALCKAESGRQLAIYDAGRTALNAGGGEK